MKSVFEYFHNVEHYVVAIAFALINTLIRPANKSVGFYVTEFVISVITASVVGQICVDLGWSTSLSFTCVAVSALLARDLLTFILGFGEYVTTHRESVYRKLLSFLFDKVTGTKSAEATVIVEEPVQEEPTPQKGQIKEGE